MHRGVLLSLAWLTPLVMLIAPTTVAAQSELDLERIARADFFDVGNATLGDWHDQLHLEGDELRPSLPGADLAGPAATLILACLVGLTGGITALMSIEEAPPATHRAGLVIVGIGGGLVILGIAWLIERVVASRSGEEIQRYRSIGRALNQVHRTMRRRGMPLER